MQLYSILYILNVKRQFGFWARYALISCVNCDRLSFFAEIQIFFGAACCVGMIEFQFCELYLSFSYITLLHMIWVRLSSQQYHRHHWVRLRGIIDTVGVESDSTVSSTPLSQTPQYHWHHWVRLRSIIDTMLRLTPQYHWHHWVRLRSINDIMESYSTVSWTPLSKTPQYHWHHWVWLRGIIDTVESDSAVLIIDTADF